MSDEKTLLPCPLCGGQPDFQHFNITPKVKGRIICACGIELRQGENETEDDIRIIWNTRATLGRGTCRVVRKPVSYSDDWKESLEAAGVVEVYTPTCSECGAYIEPPSEFAAGWNYCPNCGRRIEVGA